MEREDDAREWRKKMQNNVTKNYQSIVTNKCVLCYEYIDSWGEYNETSLPRTEQFFTKLNN